MNQPPNQNQGQIVGKNSAKPRTQPVYVAIIMRGGATKDDDGPIPQILLEALKKVQFDFDAEK